MPASVSVVQSLVSWLTNWALSAGAIDCHLASNHDWTSGLVSIDGANDWLTRSRYRMTTDVQRQGAGVPSAGVALRTTNELAGVSTGEDPVFGHYLAGADGCPVANGLLHIAACSGW